MKSRLFAFMLCFMLLCGCAADLPDNGNTDLPDTPAEDIIPPENTPGQDIPENNAPEEDPSSDEEDTTSAFLTEEELTEWENYFNTWENNGLLRFPYSDPAGDPDQLAPYLGWLFYDIGESESTFTEEELALLSETDLWLELDAFRLSREYMNRYLHEHFNISAEKTEDLFDAAQVGVYLLEYDAWYTAHGDCAYGPYEFDVGVKCLDGRVKLYYFNSFLSVAQENGETEYVDADMIITLAPREDGTWYVSAHEINRSNRNEQ